MIACLIKKIGKRYFHFLRGIFFILFFFSIYIMVDEGYSLSCFFFLFVNEEKFHLMSKHDFIIN